MRRVLFDPLLGMHSSFWEIVRYPPAGYEFVLSNTLWDHVFERLVVRNELISANFAFVSFMNKLFPPRLLKTVLDKVLKGNLRRNDIDLVFSMDHIILERKPWVLLITWPTALAGMNLNHLRKYKGFIERCLASDYCKKIITWSEAAKACILASFDARVIERKMIVVPLAFHKQSFVKSYDTSKIKLLFVGTANAPGGRIAAILGAKFFFDFDGKGGKEVLEAFRILSKRYSNLELVIRSGVPLKTKRKFEGHPNIRIFDHVISSEQLAAEFRSADIFLYPTHQLTPWTVFLEAMSYELPIVTTNLYANPEVVKDCATGLLIRPSRMVPYYWDKFHLPMGSPLHKEYMEAIKTPDPEMVADLVAKASYLIEHPDERRAMGRRARWEVENGRHCLKRRNDLFKEIFDSATCTGGSPGCKS